MGWFYKRGWFYKFALQGGAGGMNTAIETISAVLSRPNNATLPYAWISALNDWGQYLAINRGLSLCTLENYLHGMARWMRYLVACGLDLSTAESRHVVEWQRSSFLEHHEVSATRALNLTAVRQFYEWRELSGAAGNPARVVRGPKKVRRMPQKFTDQQLTALFKTPDRTRAMGVRDFAMLLFFYNTGARLMEVAALSANQVVLRKNTAWVKFMGKGRKERIVPFEGPAVDALQEWIVERDKYANQGEDAMFIGLTTRNKGARLKREGVITVMTRALKRAQIKKYQDDPIGLHRIRSSYATALYDSGKDLITIQHLLGHERPDTTQLYLAISDRQLQQKLPGTKTSELLQEAPNVPGYIKQKTKHRQ